MEALVLPVEFPAVAGAGGDCPAREVGEGVIDWTGVEKSKLIATLPQWGPYWSITFDLFLNSIPSRHNFNEYSHKGNVLTFGRFQRFQLWLPANKKLPELIVWGPGSNPVYPVKFEKKNLEIKKWHKIELERRLLEKKVRIVNSNGQVRII